ncbi:autotransporter outer membrane beta-barrel domain-containing protein [Pluralibacter gergoviae]|uniref:autotransporter outer membrane beta-barrel domain-containing protein n=1 Tax=Pluralibacter gergoviae TaxID=61647 RepID=UPI00290E94F5|nr:autotransporter outer membrane beta-barrel domain-containing protein [Pluralibacter gergoviae]MDU4005688.1 autotransporter outer membrane beta-barrel domain-containing protein [Pluralibacter gergoviae]
MRTFKVNTLARVIKGTLMIGASCLASGIPYSYADPTVISDETRDHLSALEVGMEIVGTNINIITAAEGDNGHSVVAENGGRIALTDSYVSSIADGVDAVTAQVLSASVITNNVNIETGGDNAWGALAFNTGTISLNGGRINTSGADSIGAAANYARVDADNIAIGTTGKDADAVAAFNQGQLTIHDGQITTAGDDARGAVASGAGSIMSIDGGSITTQGEDAYGVLALNAGIADINDGTVTTSGLYSHGLVSYGSDATLTAKSSVIETSGEAANGLQSQNRGHIVIQSSKVSTTGLNGIGMYSTGTGSSIEAQDVDIQTSAERAYGVGVMGAASAAIRGGSVTTAGPEAYGLASGGAGSSLTAENVAVLTGGENGYGALAEKGGKIAIQGGKITTTGLQASGIALRNPDSAVETQDVSIQTSGDYASGVGVTLGSGATIRGGAIATTGVESHGLTSSDAGSLLNAQDVDIKTGGENAYGTYAIKGTTAAINGGNINTTGQGGVGVAIRDSGTSVDVSDLTIATSGEVAYGVVALDGGKATVTGGTIITHGKESHGVGAGDAGSSAVVKQVSIETSGEMARGANVSNAEMTLDNSDITTHGENAYGIFVNKGGHAVATNGSVLTSGVQGHGLGVTDAGSSLTAEGLAVETRNAYAMGADAASGGEITLKDARVNTLGEGAYGLTMYDGGAISVSGSEVQTQGANAHAIQATRDGIDGSTGSAAVNTVRVTNSSLKSAQGDTIHAEGTAMDVAFDQVKDQSAGSGLLINALNDQSGNRATVNFSAKDSALVGDIVAEDGNSVSVTLDNTTYTGAVKNGATLALNSGSTWNVTGDSRLSQSLDNAATIAFAAPVNGHYKTLTTQNYTGNGGTIIFNSVLGDDSSQSDRLVILGDSAGSSNVRVNNLGGKGAQTIEGIELIAVGGKSDGVFARSGRIAAGAYDYDLQKRDKNWYLTSTYVEPVKPVDPVDPVTPTDPVTPVDPATPTDPVTPVDPVTPTEPVKPVEPVTPTDPATPVDPAKPAEPAEPVTPVDPGGKGGGGGTSGSAKHVYRPETGSYAANLMAANTLFNLTLHDRLGETQYTDVLTGEQKVTSLWMRNEGGHQRSKMAGGQNKTQANRYVVQLGGDLAQWTSNGLDRYHLGAMVGYANQKSRTHSSLTGYHSRGQIHGYSTGLYGTWYANEADKSGLYVDSWVQYSWFKNKVNGDELPAEKYNSRGFTASLESGYSFLLGETRTAENMVNSYWIQPQAQAIWMGVKDKKHTEDNGTRVRGKGQNNIQTRLGMKAYMQGHSAMDEGKERNFQPFVEASWIHNTKRFGVTMDSVTTKMDGARNIAEIKTGVEGQISQNVNLWGNVAQQVGDKKYSDTQAAIGIKYLF